MYTSDAVTRSIRVHVTARYSPQHSDPTQKQWFFLYTVEITNDSSDIAQLLSRHWIITDANKHVEEVRGQGVVGKQPILRPGESFRYTSGCPLSTPFGSMREYLPHGHAGRRSIRHRDRCLCLDRTVHSPLNKRRRVRAHRRRRSERLAVKRTAIEITGQ